MSVPVFKFFLLISSRTVPERNPLFAVLIFGPSFLYDVLYLTTIQPAFQYCYARVQNTLSIYLSLCLVYGLTTS